VDSLSEETDLLDIESELLEDVSDSFDIESIKEEDTSVELSLEDDSVDFLSEETDLLDVESDSLEDVSDSFEIESMEEEDASVEFSVEDGSMDSLSEEMNYLDVESNSLEDFLDIESDSLEDFLDIESDSLEDEDTSIRFSLEDKIREFMSHSENTFDEENEEDSSSVDYSMDKADWWPDFNRWLAEKDFVEEEEISDEGSLMEQWDSSVDSLQGKIQAFMSENEHIWDKYYDDDTSGEFSMDTMDWWSDFNRWIVKNDHLEEEEFSDVDAFTEEYDSSVDSLEDKIREFMSENEDIWDKYFEEDTSSEDISVEFSMDKMDWWADFNRWLAERESVYEEDSTEEVDSKYNEDSYSKEVALEVLIREFMSENEDTLDERSEEDSSSGEISMEDKDWWSEFNRWLAEKETVSTSDMESIDESDLASYSSSDESQSSSDVGANSEENGSSSDEPCKKRKGWFKGKIHSPIIITLIVFLAIIVCLVIMETKRKRDKGRRSMRVKMLSSGGVVKTPAIKYLNKDKARKAAETDDGPEYKAFTNLV